MTLRQKATKNVVKSFQDQKKSFFFSIHSFLANAIFRENVNPKVLRMTDKTRFKPVSQLVSVSFLVVFKSWNLYHISEFFTVLKLSSFKQLSLWCFLFILAASLRYQTKRVLNLVEMVLSPYLYFRRSHPRHLFLYVRSCQTAMQIDEKRIWKIISLVSATRIWIRNLLIKNLLA